MKSREEIETTVADADALELLFYAARLRRAMALRKTPRGLRASARRAYSSTTPSSGSLSKSKRRQTWLIENHPAAMLGKTLRQTTSSRRTDPWSRARDLRAGALCGWKPRHATRVDHPATCEAGGADRRSDDRRARAPLAAAAEGIHGRRDELASPAPRRSPARSSATARISA